MLQDFRDAWKYKRTADASQPATTSADFDDLFLGYIKITLESKQDSYAMKTISNLLACALPLMVMSKVDPPPSDQKRRGHRSKGPTPPELLDGLAEYIEKSYLK